MKVIGLTGGIATGKTTVAAVLRQEGVPVIDADKIARDVVAPGRPALRAIVDRFGADVLSANGTLDRPKMRARIVADAAARRDLEEITHPAIREAMLRKLASMAMEGAPVAVVEAALMVETGSYEVYQDVVVVACTPENQLQRVMARDNASEDAARAIIATQMPIDEKVKVATHVLRNDGSVDDLRAAVRVLWKSLAPEAPPADES